jgi:hypothetical protein
MNISMLEVTKRLEFGINRLKTESLSAKQQAEILRAIGAISKQRQEEIENQLKEAA